MYSNLCYVIHSTYYLRYIAFVWITSISGIQGYITVPPQNVAVNVGSGTSLNCTTNATFLSWSFYAANSAGSAVQIVNNVCAPISGTTTCDITSNLITTGTCQLVISNSSPDCAGYYLCQELTAPTSAYSSAMVIVLDSSSPICSANATNNTQVETSTLVSMNCEVSYTTPYLVPQLNWSNPSDTIHSNSSYTYSSVSFVNTIPLLPSATCNLIFPTPVNIPPTNPTSTPSNITPSYRSSCTVAAIAPLFIPTTTLSTRTTHETSAVQMTTGFWATSPSQDVSTTDRLGTGGESSNDGLIAVCVCLGISVTINIIMIVMNVVMFRRQRITKQDRADDQVGSVNNRYCEEITAYENVAQPISIETTGYEHLNPSIDISPYQELANRHNN